ncbi:ABC transporter permease [Brevibacterium daeguense]|uniref:ABC transporter permease n=1 Tax=Brevibacterium daeguense TaxID=909936 RepID=A0ABP8EF18_9MICO|nr:ABC transporter permease [Brevibacterium daeguense]
MLRLIIMRLLAAVGVVLGAAVVTFFATRAMGDPALAIAGGPESQPTPEVLAQIRADYGLDDPLVVQFLAYLGNLLTGDLGTSYRLEVPVTAAIGEQLPSTLLLALGAAVVAVIVSFVLALATAGRPSRKASGVLELAFASTPVFWLGLLLLSLFSYGLGWFPSISTSDPRSLVLPSVTLGLPIGGLLTQVLRTALEEALEQPFVLSARARGLGEAAVRLRHALRHSLIPYLTMSGYVAGALLGGAVITETLFNRQGIGSLLLSSVTTQDLPVVMGIVVLSAAIFALVNLLVDLSYPIIDRRLKEHAA